MGSRVGATLVWPSPTMRGDPRHLDDDLVPLEARDARVERAPRPSRTARASWCGRGSCAAGASPAPCTAGLPARPGPPPCRRSRRRGRELEQKSRARKNAEETRRRLRHPARSGRRGSRRSRLARRASVMSCVMTTRVEPCFQSSVKRPMMSPPADVSRLPVGSSARTTSGCMARARAIATRCIWPPESSVGLWSMRSARPTRPSSSSTRSRRFFGATPPKRSGSSTFSKAVIWGSRLKPWKTKPTRRLRTSASCVAGELRHVLAAQTVACPSVGVSRQPMRFMSVDLPEPEGPTIATNSPLSTSRSMPFRASTLTLPVS